jgi:hypothetical protein
MFDRYIRLAKAKDALAGGRFEEAAKIASDPKIADDRRAVAIRNDAQKALCARARERAAKGDLPTAVREFERAQAIGASADIEVEVEALRRQLAEQQRNAAASDEALRRARRLADQGSLADAERELASLPSEGSNAEREALASHVRGKRERATEQLMAARDALAAGDLAAAQDALLRARACDADASGPQCAAVVKAVVGGETCGSRLLNRNGDAATYFLPVLGGNVEWPEPRWLRLPWRARRWRRRWPLLTRPRKSARESRRCLSFSREISCSRAECDSCYAAGAGTSRTARFPALRY